MIPITISIVSHQQLKLVSGLLADLSKVGFPLEQCILTLNINEDESHVNNKIAQLGQVIRNGEPVGFGGNHNKAVKDGDSEFILILNPDVRISENVFEELLLHFTDPSVAIVAPKICNQFGETEDSARYFPTIISLFMKVLGIGDGGIYKPENKGCYEVDWVGGMFLLVRRSAFEAVGGFDERYFLYYEDVDLCARVKKNGWRIIVDPNLKVIHMAQRESHRSFKYLLWHASSILKYFWRYGLFAQKTRQ